MRLLLFSISVLIACTPTARAHANLQNAMWVRFEPSLVRVVVNVSVKELSIAHGVQGLPVGGVGRLDTAAIQRAAADHRDYVLKHLTLSAGTSDLPGKLIGVKSPPFFSEPDQTFYQYEIEYPVPGPAPEEIGFFHEMLKEWPYAAGTPWNLSYVIRPMQESAGEVPTWLLRYQQRAMIPTGWKNPLAPASAVVKEDGTRHFREYLWHGIMHILTGYDHLLFVSALVLATLNFWEMVKVIAAFTLAHTLTLALCVFGIFRIPSFIVEPLIAVSIVFVALENIFRPQRVHSRVRLAVAFGFGLVHGLGFAGSLLDAMAGLPSVGIWVALVAFSLGVEIGHQIVVLPLFGALGLGRHHLDAGLQAGILKWGSVVISCCGAYYLVIALQQQFVSR